ncbi:MAG: tetratricopeptide repeat protein [Myxococcales bacterium]
MEKSDAFTEAVGPLVEKLEQHWKIVAMAAAGVIVAAVAAITGLTLSAHHDEAAAAAFGDALRTAEKEVVEPGEAAPPDQADAPKDKADYFDSEREKQAAIAAAAEAVAQKDSGTPSGRTALLTLGDADYRLGKWGDALAAYGKVLDQEPPADPLRAFALQGQAYALLGEGKGDEAIAAARKLVEGAPGGFGRDLGLLAEGRIAEQLGKLDVAKDAYQKLSVDYPTTAAGRTASERLSALGVPPPQPTGKLAPPHP